MYPTKKYLATYFDCSEDHIENEIARQYDGITFSALRERAMEGRKIEVMQWAFKYAAAGNDNLIKFIMKNLHKWNDKLEVESSGSQTFELKYNIVKKEHPQLEERVVSSEEKKSDDSNN